MYAIIAQSQGDPEIALQRFVHPGDHVSDDLRWRVPDAERPTELGVVCAEEGLVEVLYRIAASKASEEPVAVDPRHHMLSPVQDLVEADRQVARGRHLLEQGPNHGDVQG